MHRPPSLGKVVQLRDVQLVRTSVVARTRAELLEKGDFAVSGGRSKERDGDTADEELVSSGGITGGICPGVLRRASPGVEGDCVGAAADLASVTALGVVGAADVAAGVCDQLGTGVEVVESVTAEAL